jgi:uncharacterized phiE125 gp8 family phage protein
MLTGVRVLTPPAPVLTLEEVKAQCNVADSFCGDDALFSRLMVAAQAAAEGETRRAIGEQTLAATFEAWSGRLAIDLPRPVLQGVESVTIDGEAVSADAYSVRAERLVGQVVPVSAWPSGDVLTVTYHAGWSSGDTPAPVKQWLLVRIADWYAQRESFIGGNVSEFGRSFVDALLDPYRIPAVA